MSHQGLTESSIIPRFFRKIFSILASVFWINLLLQFVLTIVCGETNFNVSLRGPYAPHSGAVLISMNGGPWKTICAFTEFEVDWKLASVVCRQLGHGPVVAATNNLDYPVKPNWFSSRHLNCSGFEWSLSGCWYDRKSGKCKSYALEVECLPSNQPEFSLAISQLDGTVYTISEGHWGAMCHYDDNGAEVALVICRELGFTEGEVIPGGETIQGPVLSVNYCYGSESSIRDCRSQPLDGSQCFPIQRITKVNCFNGADLLDDGNVYDSVPYSPDDDDHGSPVSGIVFFIFVSSFFGSICYCVCCKRSDRRATNQPYNTNTTNTMASAPVSGPPPAYKDVVALPGQGTSMVYPPPGSNQGYPQTGGPGYQPVPTQPPGYPPSGGPGYPPATAPGYPPAPGSGYHPTGYPSPSSVPPPGYPPPEYPPVRAPSNPLMAGPGYPTQSNPAPFLSTSASPPLYPGGTPHSYSAGAASQDIQLQPYPVNEKQGPPDQSSYQQGPPDQSSYQGVTPYPTAPGPPEEHQPPMATAPPIEKEVFDKV